MLEMADIRAGQHVPDVAAGAGDQPLDIARRVGPSGGVVAADISAGIFALAGQNAEHVGYGNVDFHRADAQNLGLGWGRFDAEVCRLGLMFLRDPRADLDEIRRALKPGGRLCKMVIAGPEANPCIRILMSTALRDAGLPPRDPFQPGSLLSLGKPGALDDHFFTGRLRKRGHDTPGCPITFAANRRLSVLRARCPAPIVQILDPLYTPSRAVAWADIETQLDAFQTENGWVGPNALLLTAGQNPLSHSAATGSASPRDRW